MDDEVEVSAMAINVAVPEHLQWTDSRRGEEFLLTTLNVRMLRTARSREGLRTSDGRRTRGVHVVPAARLPRAAHPRRGGRHPGRAAVVRPRGLA